MCVVGEETILFVDDEPFIREIAQMILEDEGYKVFTAEDASIAFAKFLDNEPIRFTLIITDIQMPGTIDGIGLVRQIRMLGHMVPALVTSGRLFPGNLPSATQFLGKPYTKNKLLQAVDQCIGTHSQD